jgi:hypothetical protein
MRFGRFILGTVLLSSTAVSADPVVVDYVGRGDLGGFVSVEYTAIMKHIPVSQPIWAGHNRQIIHGETFNTFGLDLTRDAGDGEHVVVAPDVLFGAPAADAFHALYNATGGGSVSTDAEAVAFQAVLWELVADFSGTASSIDLNSGSLVFTGGVDQTLFDGFKAMAFDPSRQVIDSNLRVLSRAGLQRQAAVMELSSIPLPSGAMLALAGLGLLACRRCRA